MMEQRKLLDKGTKLGFPGMTCTIETCIGFGSNAVVYKGWYEDASTLDARHHVLIKELNPLRREHFDEHRLSFERGNRAHLTLLEKHPEIIGENLNTFSYHNTLYTVLGCSGGETLDRVMEKTGRETTLRMHAQRMLSVLDALEAFHDSGYLHLDISPDNILVIRQGSTERILLIDYNSVFSPEECQSGDMPYTSIKEGFTAPEVTTGNYERISYSADLYSVAAVFFACLTSRSLRGIVEKRKCGIPAVFDSECLRDAPETVRNMVASILSRGLSVLQKNRYQDIAAMKEDLLELIDRIDCVGVTHWAIFEKSRQSINRFIRDNPSLQYVTDDEALYPITVRDTDGAVMDIGEFAEKSLAQADEPVMLISGGGMGKTTAMLRMALLKNQRYSPSAAAAVYISCYGYAADEPHFIKNRILDMLKFGKKTANYEDARHELELLMQKPLTDGETKRPALLILLDGINEASGDLTLLAREIAELSRMQGVCIVLSSRSGMEGVNCRTCNLVPLSEESIAQKLLENGLLMPENREMRALLSTPMALSIFIKAARGETGQLRVSSAQELIRAYLDVLLKKEMDGLADNAPQRFMMEAAAQVVLPGIARETAKRRRSLTGLETLSAVERIYKLLGSREMLRAFPKWIGHSADIRGSAKNAEEWYGVVVCELLWRRMGLLTADEDGHFRIAHQMIEEYLIGIDQENRKKIGRRRAISRVKAALAAGVLAAVIGIYYFMFIYVRPYQENLAVSVMEYATSGYAQCQLEYQQAYEVAMLALEGDLMQFNAAYDVYTGGSAEETWNEQSAAQAASSMLETGEVFVWSGKPLDAERYQELIVRAGERALVYAGYLSVLHAAMNEEGAAMGDALTYATLVLDFLDADAAVSASLFELVTREHVHEAWTGRTGYADLFGGDSSQQMHRAPGMDGAQEDFASIHEDNWENLQAAENALRNSMLGVKYSR